MSINKPNKIIVADTDTGELMELTPLQNNKHHNTYINSKQKFIKIFAPTILILPKLNKSELIILQHIIFNLKPNKLQVPITNELIPIPKSSYQRAINNLTNKYKLITKTNNEFIYTINPDFLINGKYYNQNEQISNILQPKFKNKLQNEVNNQLNNKSSILSLLG